MPMWWMRRGDGPCTGPPSRDARRRVISSFLGVSDVDFVKSKSTLRNLESRATFFTFSGNLEQLNDYIWRCNSWMAVKWVFNGHVQYGHLVLAINRYDWCLVDDHCHLMGYFIEIQGIGSGPSAVNTLVRCLLVNKHGNGNIHNL